MDILHLAAPCRNVPVTFTLDLTMPAEYYEVRILVRHPRLAEDTLKAWFGDVPEYSANVGDRGKKYSFWSKIDRVAGQRSFSSGVMKALDWLEGKAQAVSEVCTSGGTVELILEFPGDRNIGDSLEPKELARAVALGVSLGIEVFPVMKGAPT